MPFESKKIGNDDEVGDLLGDVDEEELRKAIEESLKLAGEGQDQINGKPNGEYPVKDEAGNINQQQDYL